MNDTLHSNRAAHALVVTLETLGHVAAIRLNRPQAGNAIDADVAKHLLQCLRRVRDERGIRALCLTGAGESFCVGGDLKAFMDPSRSMASAIEEILDPIQKAVEVLLSLPVPVVIAVNGVAAGGGMGLALCGDHVVMSERASFRTAYAAIGLCGDAGITYLLPRLVGLAKAREWMLHNTRIDAATALQQGLVTEIADPASVFDRALAVAHGLAEGMPAAQTRMRSLLLDSGSRSLASQLEAESSGMLALASGTDAPLAVRGFLDRKTRLSR